MFMLQQSYQQKFDEKLMERFFNTHKFSNHDKFLLLFRKGVYPYEYIDDGEKFNETSLPEKEDFYSHLNMKKTILIQITCLQKEFVKILQ